MQLNIPDSRADVPYTTELPCELQHENSTIQNLHTSTVLPMSNMDTSSKRYTKTGYNRNGMPIYDYQSNTNRQNQKQKTLEDKQI